MRRAGGAKRSAPVGTTAVADQAAAGSDVRDASSVEPRSGSKRRRGGSEASVEAPAKNEDSAATSSSRGAKGSIDLRCYEELDGPAKNTLVRIKTLTRAPTVPADSPSPVDSTDMADFFESADFLQPPIARAHTTQPETPASGRRANPAPASSSYDQRMASVMSSVAAGSKVKDAATLAPANLLETPTWPRDWSLKTSVKFVSLTPFHILPSNPSARAKHVASLLPALAGEESSPTDACHRALIHYRHPASPLPTAFSEVFSRLNEAIPAGPGSSKHKEESEWVSERTHIWGDALISAYSMLKAGRSDYFYYVGPTFTVLFQSAVGDNPPTALLSQSTKNLRERLSTEGVVFSMPLLAPGSEKVAIEDMEEQRRRMHELQELGRASDIRVRTTTGLSFTDGGIDSMLLFKGSINQKGLFDFLLNRRHDKDVPLLVSPAPFLHATAAALKFTNKNNHVVSGRGGDARDAEANRYTLEVEGTILPSALRMLADSIALTQDRFLVEMRTDAKTLAFNGGLATEGQVGAPGQRAIVIRGLWEDARFAVTTGNVAQL